MSSSAEYMRAWRAANRDRALELGRRSYRTSGAKWRRNNIDRVNEQRRIRHKAAPEAAISHTRANYRRLRDRLFAGYGSTCACCGETERAFLELDHVNGGGKKHYASFTSPLSLYREVILAGFPPIYRLLCANCNRGRQRSGGVCPHQENRERGRPQGAVQPG